MCEKVRERESVCVCGDFRGRAAALFLNYFKKSELLSTSRLVTFFIENNLYHNIFELCVDVCVCMCVCVCVYVCVCGRACLCV